MAEDRNAVQRFFGCTQLCMGAIAVGGRRRFAYASEVAGAEARAKRAAKPRAPSICVDR